MKEAKEKFIRKYARPDVAILKDDNTVVEHHQQLESDLDALLKEVAKDAYHAGFINKTPHTNFTGYWDQLNK